VKSVNPDWIIIFRHLLVETPQRSEFFSTDAPGGKARNSVYDGLLHLGHITTFLMHVWRRARGGSADRGPLSRPWRLLQHYSRFSADFQQVL